MNNLKLAAKPGLQLIKLNKCHKIKQLKDNVVLSIEYCYNANTGYRIPFRIKSEKQLRGNVNVTNEI
jgi:hypothetical protein